MNIQADLTAERDNLQALEYDAMCASMNGVPVSAALQERIALAKTVIAELEAEQQAELKTLQTAYADSPEVKQTTPR